MCSVRVVVNTTEEGRCRVLADVLDEQVAATRVLVEERGNIVDEAGNEDEWALLRLLLDYIEKSAKMLSRE